jgi:hypothetical protein
MKLIVEDIMTAQLPWTLVNILILMSSRFFDPKFPLNYTIQKEKIATLANHLKKDHRY